MRIPLKMPVSICALALALALAAILAAAAPARAADSFFLEVPGIDGESATPGHPDVIELISYSLDTGGFAVVKRIDSTSDDFSLAAVSGTQFPTVSLLIYHTATPTGPPDSSLVFSDAYVSAYQAVETFDQISFSAQAVPEPSAAFALIACVGVVMLRFRSARS